MQADGQEPGSAPEPYTLGNRVWATFNFFTVYSVYFSIVLLLRFIRIKNCI